MRGYINIDGTVAQTVFTVGTGCCNGTEALTEVEAHIYSKSGGGMLLRYCAKEVSPGAITFAWTEEFYKLVAGWYVLEIATHGDRSCGEHTVRIGHDCYTQWKENRVVSTKTDDCGNTVATTPVNYSSAPAGPAGLPGIMTKFNK